MPEKNLTEAAWKSFAKGRDLKDAALLKALAGVARADKLPPDEQLAALAELDKQLAALRKLHKADKDVGAHLADVDKTVAAERKRAEQALQQAAKDDADDEAESPALLTSKLVPLLRQVRKGETMQALIANGGKTVAVLLSRKSIPPTRRKLLTEYLDVSGTVKFIAGQCLLEEKAVTFVVQAKAAGLAKGLRAALLKQAEMRLKVRVRGAEPGDVDADGEDEDTEDAANGGGDAKAARDPAVAQSAPSAQGQSAQSKETAQAAPAAAADKPPQQDAAAAAADTARRLAALAQRVARAQAGQRADAAKLRSLLDFAQDKADAGDQKAAAQGLAALEKALDAAPQAQPPGGGTGVEPAAAFNARLAALMPKVKLALNAGGPQAAAVRDQSAEAGNLAKAKAYDAAQTALDELEALLARQPAAAAPAAGQQGQPGQQQADCDALSARLRPDFEAATGPGASTALAEQVAQLQRAWNLAEEAAAAGNHERALVILRRLADGELLKTLLQDRARAPGNADKPSGIVAQRKFMLTRWARMPVELRSSLQGLKTVIVDQDADADPDELTAALDAGLQNLLTELQNDMDAAIASGDTAAFKGLRDRVESSWLMKLLADSPLIDGARFKAATLAAMSEIETALTPA